MSDSKSNEIKSVEQGDSALFFDKNTPLVYFIFERYFKRFERYKEDLIQCGLMGLWKACSKFDKDKGMQFSTFASICIKNEMGMFLRKELKHYNNTVSFYMLDENGQRANIVDIIEDKKQSEFVDDINMKMCLSGAEELHKYAHGKTMGEIAKETRKTNQQIYGILVKQKRQFEERIKQN